MRDHTLDSPRWPHRLDDWFHLFPPPPTPYTPGFSFRSHENLLSRGGPRTTSNSLYNQGKQKTEWVNDTKKKNNKVGRRAWVFEWHEGRALRWKHIRLLRRMSLERRWHPLVNTWKQEARQFKPRCYLRFRLRQTIIDLSDTEPIVHSFTGSVLSSRFHNFLLVIPIQISF